MHLGFKVLGPHQETRLIPHMQLLSLVSRTKVGGTCLRSSSKPVLVGTD